MLSLPVGAASRLDLTYDHETSLINIVETHQRCCIAIWEARILLQSSMQLADESSIFLSLLIEAISAQS